MEKASVSTLLCYVDCRMLWWNSVDSWIIDDRHLIVYFPGKREPANQQTTRIPSTTFPPQLLTYRNAIANFHGQCYDILLWVTLTRSHADWQLSQQEEKTVTNMITASITSNTHTHTIHHWNTFHQAALHYHFISSEKEIKPTAKI